MPATPIYALPYPAATDPADVPLDMKELADQIEAIWTAALTAITLSAPWSNVGGTWRPAAYTRRGGIVLCSGLIKASSAPSPGQLIFTLPTGYRPSGGAVIVMGQSATGVSRLDVQTNGQVQFGAALAGADATQHLSLNGIVFPAEA